MNRIRILVTGSREVDGAAEIIVRNVLDDAHKFCRPWPILIVHGAGRGVDTIAGFWAGALGVPTERHRADWEVYGKAAGPERNAEMVALGAHICLAFPRPSSRGTWDCIRRAADAGIQVRIHPLPELPS